MRSLSRALYRLLKTEERVHHARVSPRIRVTHLRDILKTKIHKLRVAATVTYTGLHREFIVECIGPYTAAGTHTDTKTYAYTTVVQ